VRFKVWQEISDKPSTSQKTAISYQVQLSRESSVVSCPSFVRSSILTWPGILPRAGVRRRIWGNDGLAEAGWTCIVAICPPALPTFVKQRRTRRERRRSRVVRPFYCQVSFHELPSVAAIHTSLTPIVNANLCSAQVFHML